MKKKIGSILALIMIFSFLPLQVQADVKAPMSVSLEIIGDTDMGTIYNEDMDVLEGETAFDVLITATEKNKIALEYDKEWKYATGINGLNQLDKGPNSGWMYKVNGVSEQVGAGDRVLIEGDKVLFYYTVDYTQEYEAEEEIEEVEEEDSFGDLLEASKWALPSIEKAIELGIVGGDDQGNINPKGNITRAEFIKILLIIMDEEAETIFEGKFTDVNKDAWYAYNIETADKLGLVKGRGNGLFSPNATLTTQDMAVILARAYSLEGTESDVLDFDKVSDYAKTSVASVIDNNVMAGVGNDLFAPKVDVTREMAITTMVRLLGR